MIVHKAKDHKYAYIQLDNQVIFEPVKGQDGINIYLLDKKLQFSII